MWDTKHIGIKSEPLFHKSRVKISIKAWKNLQTFSALKLKLFLWGLIKHEKSRT